MDWIMGLVGTPLGWIMWLMYTVIPNYMVALLLFTLFIKLALIPLAIKQQRGSIKMQIMQPKIKEIQDKYKNNQAKMQEEMQALYKRENYNMLAGCGPLLIQMPILFGLIDVIYKPLTHILRIPDETVDAMMQIMTDNGIDTMVSGIEIRMLSAVQSNPTMFSSIGNEYIEKISSLNLTYFGIDMAATPSEFGWFSMYMLVPLLSGATAFMMSMISMRNSPSANNANSSMKTMMYISPLMSLWFTTMVPLGVGFYWIFSNVFGAVQSVILNKLWNPKEMAEKIKAEQEALRQEERQNKIETKKKARETGETVDVKVLSQKEANKQKLAAARKRNAELYGDYTDVEVSDDDVK